MLQKTFSRALGCALLLYGGSALSFTLITPPPEQVPSEAITTATTLETLIQPIASSIRAQLFSIQRLKRVQRVSQSGPVLVASAEGRGGVEYLAATETRGTGTGGGGGSESLWISTAANSLENDFSRTAFRGATHSLLAGFDMTRAERYVVGFSVGHEASNYSTTFNAGDEKTRGFSVNPYFAYLLSDAWSVDLIAGYGEYDTRQSRTVGTGLLTTATLSSEFPSTRSFGSTNLTYLAALGNWKLSGALGYTATRREQEAYLEAGPLGTAVASSKQTVKQATLFGEAAYGRGASETYFGMLYEDTRDPQRVRFATGAQPANDPDSVLLSAGWRYFGRGMTANFAFVKRVAQEQVNEYGFSMMLRVDL